jgi:hypothetical protein
MLNDGRPLYLECVIPSARQGFFECSFSYTRSSAFKLLDIVCSGSFLNLVKLAIDLNILFF